MEIKEIEKEIKCTKCGKIIKSGEKALTNTCIGKSGCFEAKYEEKKQQWCEKCGKFVLEKKLVHESIKIATMLCEL